MGVLELEKLVSFENSRLTLDGENLAEIANMYYMCVSDYLDLCKLYLSDLDAKISCAYILNQTTTQLKDEGYCCRFTRSGEILVPVYAYNNMKRRLFDLAYTCCSDYEGKEVMEERKSLDVYDDIFRNQLTNCGPTYSAFYKGVDNKWTQVVMATTVDREDQEKRYSLISR